MTTVEFHHRELPNGLTVAAETNTDAHTAAVGFFVKTGTRDEQRPVMGVTHFLEHMMFKGTERRSAADVNREFDEMGANYNAYTSHEATVYYAQVLPEFLSGAIDLIGDILRPALRNDDFDMEKNVIIEEIGMYEDQPFMRLHNRLVESYFGDHPLGYRVLGTVESIEALEAQQMREYFERRYSPDNIVVAAAGKFDIDKLVDDVTAIAGDWQPTGAERDYAMPDLGVHDVSMPDEKVTRHYVEMLCPAPSSQDDRRYAASVMADVIGDDEGSRLYWALVDPGLADEADMVYYPQDQHGCFAASASCDPKRAEQVEKLLIDTIDAYTDSIDEHEIERSKNKLATQLILRSENPNGCMRSIGGQWLYRGEYLPLDQQLSRLTAVSADDVRSLLADMPMHPRTTVRLGPK